jgi:glycosyltransferase involved in cell wall biosynthesis
MDIPLISVIVCTYNRHEFLLRALDSVTLQDFEDFEIIIVDDGSTPPVNLPTRHLQKARLIQIEHRGVGAARATGLNAARGNFIAYCDGDDEWTPNHLSTLLKYLQEHTEVDLVYADSEWVYGEGAASVPYSFDYDVFELYNANFIFPSNVMHRVNAARNAGGFDESLQSNEDWDLWLRMSQIYVLRHLPVILGTRRWHEDCISESDHWAEWKQVYENHQTRIAKEGIAHGHRLSGGTEIVPFDRNTWQDNRKELLWRSILYPTTSYGTVARNLLPAVERQGVDVTMAPFGNQPAIGYERFYKPLNQWNKLAFYYDYRTRPSVIRASERVIAYTMWESTLVPQEQVEEINQSVTSLYVPCRQNVESYLNCGVRVPINVLHHGVDAEKFSYLSRSPREFFTFGSFGDFSPRKGIDVLIRAFQDEFSLKEPVRLLLKSTNSSPPYEIKDSRITLIAGFMSQHSPEGLSRLLDFLRQMDVFVMPSRGEGFGLCGIEAMATGLPLIATNWSGPVEYLDSADSYPLSYDLIDANGTKAHGAQFYGKWAEPDYEHLRHLMRWLYEHPEAAAAKGRLAAERVHRDWTWDRVAKQMVDDFDAIASE